MMYFKLQSFVIESSWTWKYVYNYHVSVRLPDCTCITFADRGKQVRRKKVRTAVR